MYIDSDYILKLEVLNSNPIFYTITSSRYHIKDELINLYMTPSYFLAKNIPICILVNIIIIYL